MGTVSQPGLIILCQAQNLNCRFRIPLFASVERVDMHYVYITHSYSLLSILSCQLLFVDDSPIPV